jgi:histidinol-phosphate/aromatic aminotransferase/cobyric acid decarboxylase-like protein
VAIPPEPTHPLFRVASVLAGASIGNDASELTFACRPGNPFGDLPDLRSIAARLDEAYFEYAGVSAAGLIHDEQVVVIRTFSKAFALAGARVGYVLAGSELAAELRAPVAGASLEALGGARSCRAALSARRGLGDRGA